MAVKLIYKDIAPGAKDDISNIEVSEINDMIANEGMLKDNSLVHKNYATLEYNHWKLDGTFTGIAERNIPYWSTQVCADTATDGKYYFDTPITITRVFANKHTSVGISFVFDDTDFCNALNIKWFNDDELLYDIDFEPDSSNYYCQQNVQSFNKVVITFYSMNTANRFLKIFAIDDGVNREFGSDNLYGVSVLEEMSLISEELPINTLSATLKRSENTEYIFQKKQPILVYYNSALYGTFFVDGSDRTSKDVYEVTAQDYKGVLDTATFYGGIYSNVTAKSIIDEIFMDEKFGYTIDDETASTILSGYIPICTKREALAQVLFAACSVCDTSRSNTLDIFKLGNTQTEISSESIFMGGKITASDIVTSVKIQIHKYERNNEAKEVFKGDVSAGQSMIEFSNPIDANTDVTITGAAIISCYANYCIIEAQTDTSVIITAREFIDNIVSKVMVNDNVTLGAATNQVEIKDATLVSNSNADAVLFNVYNHYMKNNTLESDVIIDGYKCGDSVILHTEWSGDKTGRIEQLEYDICNKTIGRVVQRVDG